MARLQVHHQFLNLIKSEYKIKQFFYRSWQTLTVEEDRYILWLAYPEHLFDNRNRMYAAVQI